MYSGSPSPALHVAPATSRDPNPAPRDEGPTFDSVYQDHAPYVWRAACRLGVSQSSAEDVVQDTFLVVHRRLSEYEERSSMRAWLFAILVRVVRDHRRRARRKPLGGEAPLDADACADTGTPSPLDAAERMQAVRELYSILDSMSDERREVFVLVELEELAVPEVARALSANINTVYFRLRAARREFEKAIVRHRAKKARRS
jgi:RNA polymerase sigma-70 factor (ECF subfamily)